MRSALASALVVAGSLAFTGVAAAQDSPPSTGEQPSAAARVSGDERQERRKERRRAALQLAAEAIGIPAKELAGELRSGATVAEVAQANGTDPQAVIEALVSAAHAKIDAAVADGKLDAQRAEALKGKAVEVIERWVTEGFGSRR